MPTSHPFVVREPVLDAPPKTIQAASWFAVHTRPRHEKTVAASLREKGIETLLPLISAKHQWSDRRRLVHSPLFPGYVFTRVVETTNAHLAVVRTAGVIAFVGIRGKGLPIPDEQIETVQGILDRGIPFTTCPFLREGQRVRIRGGSLDGLQGILLAKNNDQSLIVSVDIIQRSLAVRVTGYRVESA
jgi:transcription termination/antitermination protein NusG